VKDITLQLVENAPAKNADIILGGGLASFLPYYGLYNTTGLRHCPE
jgi:alkaline phosphatase